MQTDIDVVAGESGVPPELRTSPLPPPVPPKLFDPMEKPVDMDDYDPAIRSEN